MTNREQLQEQLDTIGDTDRPFALADLKPFSDLDPGSVPCLQETWRQIPSDRRIEVVKALLQLSEENIDNDFRQMFLMCLDDPDPSVRSIAIDGLWEDERPRTLRRLLQLSSDPSRKVRVAVMLALSHFAYRAVVGDLAEEQSSELYRVLLEIVSDIDQPLEVRRRALESLGYFGESSEVHTEIGRAYRHTDQLMRESALVAMGRSMHPDWFSYIEKELHSNSPALRYEAARAVGELAEEGRELVPSLLPLIEDEDNEVLQAAIWALGQVGGSHAHRLLHRIAQSKDPTRAEAAEEALEELSLFDEEGL